MTSLARQGSVVVGVDGSRGGDAALAWAAHYAAGRRLPLEVVHAAGALHVGSELFGPPVPAAALHGAAREVTDRAVALVRHLEPEVEICVTAPLEDPRRVLLEAADRASILVVGTRGLGPLRMLLLGAVSAAVASQATCSLAVVRPPDTGDAGVRHIVVGIDAGPASTGVLDAAFDLASVEGRALDVVHSWTERDVFVDRDSDEQRLSRHDEHQRMLAEVLAGYGEKYPDVAVETHLSSTGVLESLLELSSTASTVVVGSRQGSGAHPLSRSVSRDLVECAHCTVVVVRP